MADSTKSIIRRGMVFVIAIAIFIISIYGRFALVGVFISVGVLIFGLLHVKQAEQVTPDTIERVNREHQASPWWAVVILFVLQVWISFIATRRMDVACANDSGCWVLPTMTIFPIAVLFFAVCSLLMRRWFIGGMLGQLLGLVMTTFFFIGALFDGYPERHGIVILFFSISVVLILGGFLLWVQRKKLNNNIPLS